MPRGLNRSGDFRNGSPVTTPIDFGTDITLPHDFGNDVTWTPSPSHFGNAVTWTPNPAHFGNVITPPYPAPTFTSATPNSGPFTGGTSTTIVGSGFTVPGLQVTIGGAACTGVTVSDDQHLTCTSPAGTIGTTDIDILTNGGSVDTPNAWTYTAVTPALIAHTVRQQASNFTQPTIPSPAINTTGANFLVMGINSYDNPYAFSSGNLALVWDRVGGSADASTQVNISQSGSNSTVTPRSGNFPATAASNGWVGMYLAIAGFQSTGIPNNGYWVITASSISSVTCTNPAGVTISSGPGYAAPSTNKWFACWAGNTPNSHSYGNDLGAGIVWYCPSATVGSGHTFGEDDHSISGAGDGSSFAVAAFSNMNASPYPATGSNGTGINNTSVEGGVTTVQPGSYTPAQSNNLLITIMTGLALTGPESISGNSFVATDLAPTGALESSISMAYLVAPNTSAVNPTWSCATNGNRISATLVEFAHA